MLFNNASLVYINLSVRQNAIRTIDQFLRHIIRPEKELEVRYIKNGRSHSIHYDLEEWGFHSKDPRDESGRIAEELERD
ncbi:hypothetical protein MTLP_06130 [Candidatus Methanoliparum sp. LAM-1]|nr:hypothetical protein MTLP_06130 [Candidatus Methanoliparum sp. LAM-1]